MEHALELEAPDLCFQSLRVGVDVPSGGLVTFALRELEKLGGICDSFGGAFDLASIGL
jgi:hypothetical protein